MHTLNLPRIVIMTALILLLAMMAKSAFPSLTRSGSFYGGGNALDLIVGDSRSLAKRGTPLHPGAVGPGAVFHAGPFSELDSSGVVDRPGLATNDLGSENILKASLPSGNSRSDAGSYPVEGTNVARGAHGRDRFVGEIGAGGARTDFSGALGYYTGPATAAFGATTGGGSGITGGVSNPGTPLNSNASPTEPVMAATAAMDPTRAGEGIDRLPADVKGTNPPASPARTGILIPAPAALGAGDPTGSQGTITPPATAGRRDDNSGQLTGVPPVSGSSSPTRPNDGSATPPNAVSTPGVGIGTNDSGSVPDPRVAPGRGSSEISGIAVGARPDNKPGDMNDGASPPYSTPAPAGLGPPASSMPAGDQGQLPGRRPSTVGAAPARDTLSGQNTAGVPDATGSLPLFIIALTVVLGFRRKFLAV